MTESPVKVEWYLSQIRARINSKLKEEGFVGHIKFEINIKHRDITNVNIDTRDSLKAPDSI